MNMTNMHPEAIDLVNTSSK